MIKFFKNNLKLIGFITIFIPLIIYISYWSSYKFNFKELTFEINPIIGSHEMFWLAFSSISTFLGIIIALFKDNIYNYLYSPNLEISIDNQGIIYNVYNQIDSIYHIKVINCFKQKLKEVDFYFDSIKINNQENILNVRRPMAWSRKEEGRNNIEIFDYDQIDFIYVRINLELEHVSYRFESRYGFPSLYHYINDIQNKSEIKLVPRFYNQKINKEYKISIEFNYEIKNNIISFIKRIKDKLINELQIIKSKKIKKPPIDWVNYPLTKIIFENWLINGNNIYDWEPKNEDFDTIESCVKYLFIGKLINNFYQDRSHFIRIKENDIFIDISNLLIITYQ